MNSTCSSRWKRIVLGIWFRQPFLKLRRSCLSQQFGDQLLFALDVALNFLAMRPVIRQSGMHLRHRQMRVVGDHLSRRPAHVLDPDGDVLHLDPGSGDTRLSPAGAWGFDNEIGKSWIGRFADSG